MNRFLTSLIPYVYAADYSNIYKPSGGISAVRDVGGFMTFVLCPITNTLSVFLLAISVIMIIWAAYMYLTSSGDEDKIKKSHLTITYAAVAVAVTILAKGVPFIVAGVFYGSLGPGLCF